MDAPPAQRAAADRTTLTLRPDPVDWQGAIGASEAPDAAKQTRSELGLAPELPVIVAGHQPIIWHAGVLAKLLALCESAQRFGAQAVWVIPDMDDCDPLAARIPTGIGEAAEARTIAVLGGDAILPGRPAGSLPARDPGPSHPALPGLGEALGAFRDAGSLAEQVGRAVVRLACERFGYDEPIVITATDLTRTSAWARLLGRMTDDARVCVEAYNRAASAFPDARVRSLETQANRVELPLWRVRDSMPRHAVFTDDIETIPADELRPRALTMSAFVRALIASWSINGLGAERYDQVTDDWASGWPGFSAALTPTAPVSADAYADLGVDPTDIPNPDRARWLAHHARHEPGLVGDPDAASRKRTLVEQIRDARRNGRDPAPLFAAMHALLAETRSTHADKLAELDAEAERATALAGVRALALDRSFAWPALDAVTLDRLAGMVRERFGVGMPTRE